MSSPFWANLRTREKAEEKRGGKMHSTRHEPVYHATQGCQAASLSLTALSWRGLKRTCQVESQKNGRFLAQFALPAPDQRFLGRSTGMLLLRMLKGSRLIALPMEPHGKDDPDPDVGKCSYSNGMAFAFSSFALIIVFGPGFTLETIPKRGQTERLLERVIWWLILAADEGH